MGDIVSLDFESKFDVIIMMHVIEHLKDPIQFIKRAKQLLNKDGLLIILCPNEINSIYSKIVNFRPIAKYVYSKTNINLDFDGSIPLLSIKESSATQLHFYKQVMLQHLFYFNPKVLKKLLIQSRFKIEKSFEGEVLGKNNFIINLIKNRLINWIFHKFDIHEEIYIFAKNKL